MTDDAAFIQAIAEEPDELGPRLRYADFLDEQGGPGSARAEFIRVQCALDNLPEADPSFDTLRRREKELLGANWREWMKPICQALGEPLPVPPVKRTLGERLRGQFRRRRLPAEAAPRLELLWTTGPRPNHVITRPPLSGTTRNDFLAYARFARGFVSEVVLSARPSRGPTYLDRLFERAPVTNLALHQFDGRTMRHLEEKVLLRRLRTLDLFSPASNSLSVLIHAAGAGSLRSFGLHSLAGDTDEAGRLLAQATTLRPVKVGFHHVILRDDALEALAGSRFMDHVRHLILEGITFDREALVRLLEQSTIRVLDLIGPAGIALERHLGAALRERFPDLTLTARGHVRA